MTVSSNVSVSQCNCYFTTSIPVTSYFGTAIFFLQYVGQPEDDAKVPDTAVEGGLGDAADGTGQLQDTARGVVVKGDLEDPLDARVQLPVRRGVAAATEREEARRRSYPGEC